MLGHFKKAGVPPKRLVKEFSVTADAHVPVGVSLCSSTRVCVFLLGVGTTLSAAHFVPGQFVDVVANS
jgi:large subunit ribosomal protein L3